MDYTVRTIDKLLRFDTTNDDVIVTLLPFAQTPNAPYEIHKISVGDGHTVTILTDPATNDFLLPDGSVAIVLDDASATALIKIPADGLSPAFVSMGGGGGTGGGPGPPAPPVTINSAEVIFRGNHRVEVDVDWTAAASATKANFLGVQVYLEDPDISSGANQDMNGADMPLDATAQMSGKWAPIPVNHSLKSPAVLFLDSTMGSTPGQTYKTPRDVRIYLAAYGPNTHPNLVRATDPSPTPNIVETIPLGPTQGESGMEYAFLVSNVAVTVIPDYDRPDPNYYLIFTYAPPDPTIPVPANLNNFGGVRIKYVYEDAQGNPTFPETDTGINVPADQSDAGYKSAVYTPGARGGKFRVYFCSEDDSQPLGSHINTLVEGVTPYAEAIVPPLPGAPTVSNFVISDQKVIWLPDGSFVGQATFSWDLPDASTDGIRYAGVYLYLVNVTGGTLPLTPFPHDLTGQQGNLSTGRILQIPSLPRGQEVWTIAAISVDVNGVLADDPAQYPAIQSPTVVWNIGPPAPGSPGGGQEYAPLVTIDPGASATATEDLSADGVRMVTFDLGTWTNPTDPQFGGARISMVVDHDPSMPTYWELPKGATSFTTPAMPSFGNIGAAVAVDFYIVSEDPQGHWNSLIPGTTPVIHYDYTPTRGEIIPAREGWFDDSQFSWSGDGFTADNLSAKVVQVGKILVVGGAPASFGASDNGQIAVLNSQGKLLDWFGQQQPGQGNSQPLWGAWMGQVWIGGTNPLDAPIFVDNQGIVEVGGIAAAHGSRYPYISIRDQYGIEAGRIGAQLSVPSGSPGDSVGPGPPQLSAGAWFTQLAVGGSSLSNWNVLITSDPNNQFGSQFLMRNIQTLQIDYKEHAGSPANAHYQLQFGNAVWTGANLTGQYQFPGIHITEVDNNQNLFGAVYLNRGMVLRGPMQQNYIPLVSLVTYNGQPSGSDSPAWFWGELDMYSPGASAASNPVVQITSGSAGGYDPQFIMRNNSGNILYWIDTGGNTYIKGVLQGAQVGGVTQPVTAYAYNVVGRQVIDAAGHWVGQPIQTVGGQTPWTQTINAAGFALYDAGSVDAGSYFIHATGQQVISTAGGFRGADVDVGSGGVWCGYLSNRNGTLDCGLVHSSGSIICGQQQPGSFGVGWLAGDQLKIIGASFLNTLWINDKTAIDGNATFIGPGGVNVGTAAVLCGSVDTTRLAGAGSPNFVTTANVYASNRVSAWEYYMLYGQSPVIDSNATFRGAGILCWGFGIGCGSVRVLDAQQVNWGPIECGQLTCHGAFSADILTASGEFHAGSYWVGPREVIDASGYHVGPGVNVDGGAVYGGSLRAFRVGAGDGSIGGESLTLSGAAQIGSWCYAGGYVANGMLVINVDRTFLGAKYYASNWTLDPNLPVIDGGGNFTGPGIKLFGNGPISCGGIAMNGGDLSGCNQATVTGLNCNGNIGAYAYWGGQPGYTTQIIRYDGWFIGPGVDVQGGSIGCSWLTTQGRGGFNRVDTGQLNVNAVSCTGAMTSGSHTVSGTLTVNGQSFLNGAVGANSFYIGGTQVISGAAQFVGTGGVNIVGAGGIWTLQGDVRARFYFANGIQGKGSNLTIPLTTGSSVNMVFTEGLLTSSTFVTRVGDKIVTVDLTKEEEYGKDLSIGSEGTATTGAGRAGAHAGSGHDRRFVARHGAGQEKPGRGRREAALFSAAGPGESRRGALRSGAGAERRRVRHAAGYARTRGAGRSSNHRTA